jgi:hypothetical protein
MKRYRALLVRIPLHFPFPNIPCDDEQAPKATASAKPIPKNNNFVFIFRLI